MEESEDGNITEKITSFKFKLSVIEKLVKITEQINDKKDRTIQVFDLPLYMDTPTIKCSFSLLGEIERIHTKVLGQYQQAYILYKDASSVQCFFYKWSYFIGKEYVRVTLLSLSEEQREIRKFFSLRLSGLPFGTTTNNLRPIIEETNAMTCFISRNPFNYKLMTYAYLNFKNAKDRDIAIMKKFSIRQGKSNNNLFISDPAVQHNVCNNYAVATKLNMDNSNNNQKYCNTNKPIGNSSNNHKLNSNRPQNTTYHQLKSTTPQQKTNRKVKKLEVQITKEFTDLRHHIDSFDETINKYKKEWEERLKQNMSGLNTPAHAKSSFLPFTSKNDQNKRIQKDPEYESSSSEEQQLKDMIQTQRTLVQRFDNIAGRLQDIIEGAIHNLLGGFVTATYQHTEEEQDKILFNSDEEHLVTDNEDDADIENNIEI
ncbi:hypothetical protein RclHR1_07590003 [Rhizophagus clarus]|uniref:RRM domain-containing protein n=1 Tax=Rhizophagus clarus TaxID=94130 RepID=A0A2Z6SDE6_9GLOM|nr:hypothetical protein RclHR1_07590003 [Rhizophagus clarus]